MSYTPGIDNTELENRLQGSIAESWFIAKVTGDREDSRSKLEALGFEVGQGAMGLFYRVTPPTGITKRTEGYWTFIDRDGETIAQQFYKASPWDTDTFVNFS